MRFQYFFYLFFAGAVAAILGHQGMLAVLNSIQFTDRIPYSLAPTKPLGIPLLISLSFWAGLWGILYGSLEHKLLQIFRNRWLSAVVFAIFPITCINLFIVLPLQGRPFAGGWNPPVMITSALVNISWNLVLSLLLWKRPIKP